MQHQYIDIKKFEEMTGVTFKDQDIAREACTHRSYLNENKKSNWAHNERLEFLGDAVLELVVTDHLFKKYPDRTEGDLTAYRAALVNSVTLARAAGRMGLNDFMLLSRGEAKDTGKARQYILANAFEAVIGAIYMDQGYGEADRFIAGELFGELEEIVEKGLWRDAKSFFQEKAQEHTSITPAYKVLNEVGPDHNKDFTIGVFLGDELVSEGVGKSKQEAEQDAASKGLEKKKWSE